MEKLTAEIKDLCNSLIEDAKILYALEPVSYLSQSKITWVGGILGAVREIRENKRLEKLINAPICREMSFYRYAFHIMQTIEKLVDLQLEIQKNTTSDNSIYFGNITLINEAVNAARNAWYRYSPDMAAAGITIGDEKNVSLGLSVDDYIKTQLGRLQLPDGVHKPDNTKTTENSGCLGVLLLLIVIPALIYLIA